MSVSVDQATSGDGQTATGTEGGGGDHECKDAPPAEVYVDGRKIPVINDGLRTEMRKDGAMGITRHSEVYFPSEWDGTDFSSAVRALDPSESNVYDPVDIVIRDQMSGHARVVHRGFVMGVGGGSNGNLERRMTVGDVGQLLGGIQYSAKYEEDEDIEGVLQDVVDGLDEHLTPQIFDSINLDLRSSPEEVDDGEPERSHTLLRFFGFQYSPKEYYDATIGAIFNSKEFSENRHSVMDVIEWIDGRVEGTMYFAPSNEADPGAAELDLVYDDRPTNTVLSADHIDGRSGNVLVYRNDAIQEIRPLNTVTARGRERGGEYPEVSVAHGPLVDRANTVLSQVIESESTNIDGTEDEARAYLKKELDGSSLGEIVAAPCVDAEPFTRIQAHIACGDDVHEYEQAVEYEIEEVIHNIAAKADDGERKHETHMRVGLHIDPSDIDVVEAGRINETTSSDTYMPGEHGVLPGPGGP